MIDPYAEAILKAVRAAPPMNKIGLIASREAAKRRGSAPEVESIASVVDIAVATENGEVPVRLYRDSEKHNLPVILYLHAGGWILGDLSHSDALCRTLAKHSGALVVNVDYRLAPECQFPGPLNDCAAVLKWLMAEADLLSIDSNRIAVAGESSGGNLAAGLALMARDQSAMPIAAQILLCPALDPKMASKSWGEMGEDFLPPRQQMDWMWRAYLPTSADEENPYAAPVSANSLAGLPRCLMLTAEFDPLRDEAEEYAVRLEAAGVNVEMRRCSGQIHAFLNMSGIIPSAKEILIGLAHEVGELLRID